MIVINGDRWLVIIRYPLVSFSAAKPSKWMGLRAGKTTYKWFHFPASHVWLPEGIWDILIDWLTSIWCNWYIILPYLDDIGIKWLTCVSSDIAICDLNKYTVQQLYIHWDISIQLIYGMWTIGISFIKLNYISKLSLPHPGTTNLSEVSESIWITGTNGYEYTVYPTYFKSILGMDAYWVF